MTQTAPAPPAPVSVTAPTTAPATLAVIKRRLLPIEHRFDPYFGLGALVVTLIAAVLRLVNLGHPEQEIFDEVYYANDAQDLWERGVEWDQNNNSAGYVVHPPLGKWLIGLGIRAFGYDSFGWRISAAAFGVASVLLLTWLARRLFGSTVLGCAAGLLMAVDGMHFVLSRTALLDMFLMFFVLAAFATLVLDREQRRRRWLRFLAAGGDPAARGRAGRPPFAVPWWRLATAVLIGLGIGVKWSAAFFLPVILVLVIWWEIGARRSAGARHPVRDALLDEIGWILLFGVLVVLTYLSTWSGWLLTDDGYFRHHLRDSGGTEPPILGALQNLRHYHESAYGFHSGLADTHTYQSWPWQWLLLGRPVAFYYTGDVPCGVDQCAAEILLLGTPLLWWSFLPALGAALWFGIARRDWRAGAILAMCGAALLPWFFYSERTMFYFYALPAEPFLILAVVFVLGAIMSGPQGQPRSETRSLVGTVVAGAFVLLVALNFAYFYPIFIGESIPYADWAKRMWLGNRWI